MTTTEDLIPPDMIEAFGHAVQAGQKAQLDTYAIACRLGAVAASMLRGAYCSKNIETSLATQQSAHQHHRRLLAFSQW